MISELRATYADLHARATFTKDGDNVTDTRGVITDWLRPVQRERETNVMRTRTKMAAAFDDGFIEVG